MTAPPLDHEAAKRALQRLDRKTYMDPMSGCWLYTGALTNGYGMFFLNGRQTSAHRASYLLRVGPIPDGLHLDHLCRVPACTNPRHLEPVTSRENTLRGVSLAAQRSHVRVCPQGHPYDESNTFVSGRRQRACKECRRRHNRAYRKKYPGRGARAGKWTLL